MRKRGHNTYTVLASKHILTLSMFTYLTLNYTYMFILTSKILRIYLEYEIQFLITTT